MPQRFGEDSGDKSQPNSFDASFPGHVSWGHGCYCVVHCGTHHAEMIRVIRRRDSNTLCDEMDALWSGS